MRLCLLAEAHSIHTRRWAEHFARRGDDVLVLSLRPGSIDGARVGVIAPHRLGRAGYPLALLAARAAVRRFRPEIVHAHYATSYGLIGALLGRHPYVVSSWGTDVTNPRSRVLLRFVFGRADAICATSQFLSDVTRRYAPTGRDITITPFGVDTDLFRPARDARTSQPLTVVAARWRLDAIYGLDRLVEAFGRADLDDARLEIYGEGGQREALRAQASALGIGDRVRLPGAVGAAALGEALRAADIFVMPSLVPEAFGVAAVEASASGLPVIASATGGLGEVIVDGTTGILVPPGDVDALTLALRTLAADPGLRRRLGRAGRAHVEERYIWSASARRMESLYASLAVQRVAR